MLIDLHSFNQQSAFNNQHFQRSPLLNAEIDDF